MFVDAHHHLWDPDERDYPWMTEAVAPLRRRYELDDLRAVTTAAGVSTTVVVQASSSLEETVQLLATAEASDGLISGVVGWVDLTAIDLPDQIAGLRASPGGHRLVGARHQVHDEPDADWLTRADVIRGLRILADHDLAYDLLVRTRELPAAHHAAAVVDGLSFVLDHAAKPPIADGEFEPWSTLLTSLANLPNVSCKISGLVTEADWNEWTADDVAPYVNRLVELFSPGRLMFGSDWPVCTLAAEYDRVIQVARECLPTLSVPESAAVFGGTAAAIYHL